MGALMKYRYWILGGLVLLVVWYVVNQATQKSDDYVFNQIPV